MGEKPKKWLVKTKFSALDYIRDSIIQLSVKTKKDKTDNFDDRSYLLSDWFQDNLFRTSRQKSSIAAELTSAFGLAKAPEVAPYMLELSLSSPAGQVAKNWLRQNPEHTIPGLIPIAIENNKLGKAAIDILRDLKLKGHEELILAWLEEQENKKTAEKLKEQIFKYSGVQTS
ncbi:MAG: hypothetical protein AAF298_26390 [Cyanobacteria bacterium P01_A01_bin.40]